MSYLAVGVGAFLAGISVGLVALYVALKPRL